MPYSSVHRINFLATPLSECSGLKVNLDKTEAIWIGSKHGLDEEYFLRSHITWNHTGRFKLLGIKLDLNSPDKTLLNFSDKLQSFNKKLKYLST